jgi:threonine/homoserine/homoserine lactone efflux protein
MFAQNSSARNWRSGIVPAVGAPSHSVFGLKEVHVTITTLAALVTFCLATSITPGPNNTLLLASGVNFGFVRTVPHLFGVALGFAAMLLAIGMGLGNVFRSHPALYAVLQVYATGYILWLAWRIGSSGTLSEIRSAPRPMNFLEAASFQWINPKGWASGLGALATYVSPDAFLNDVLIVAGVFAAVMLPCIAIWAAFGVLLRRFLSRRSILRAFNIVMALLLVVSLFPIWTSLGTHWALRSSFHHLLQSQFPQPVA